MQNDTFDEIYDSTDNFEKSMNEELSNIYSLFLYSRKKTWVADDIRYLSKYIKELSTLKLCKSPVIREDYKHTTEKIQQNYN